MDFTSAGLRSSRPVAAEHDGELCPHGDGGSAGGRRRQSSACTYTDQARRSNLKEADKAGFVTTDQGAYLKISALHL
jgi:hypothetical protein